MSFLSGVIISIIEKELSEQAPEIEAYALKFIGQLADDLVKYVEKKIEASAPPRQVITKTL